MRRTTVHCRASHSRLWMARNTRAADSDSIPGLAERLVGRELVGNASLAPFRMGPTSTLALRGSVTNAPRSMRDGALIAQ